MRDRIFLKLFFFLLTGGIFLMGESGASFCQEKAADWFKKGIRASDPAQKINCYQKAIELDPMFVEAYYNLGLVYKNSGMLDAAEQSLRRALYADPTQITDELKLKIIYELGIIYKKLGRYNEALESLRGARALATNDDVRANILYELGRLETLKGNFNEAITQFETGIRLYPAKRADFAAAIKEAKRLKGIDDNYRKGIALLESNKFEEALVAFKEVTRVEPDYKDVKSKLEEVQAGLSRRQREQELKSIYDRGLAQMKNRNWQGAIESFQRIMRVNPQYKDVPQKLAEAQKGFETAFKNKIVAQHYNSGVAALRRKRWYQALVAFEKVRDLNPNYRDVTARIQEAQKGLEREGEEKAKLNYYNQGLKALEDGRYSEAIAAFEKVVAFDPQFKEVQLYLEKARQVFGEDNQDEQQQKARYYYEEGLRESQNGNWLKAIIAFEKVQLLDPNYKDVQERLTEAKLKFKDYEARSTNQTSSRSRKLNLWLLSGLLFCTAVVIVAGAFLLLPTVRARFYLWHGKPRKASAIYERLVAKKPEKMKFYITLANLYLNENRRDEAAVRVFETALSLNIDHEMKERLTAIVTQYYLTRGTPDARAIEVLEDALERELKNLEQN